jgi:hypothetical protein
MLKRLKSVRTSYDYKKNNRLIKINLAYKVEALGGDLKHLESFRLRNQHKSMSSIGTGVIYHTTLKIN